MIRCFAVLITTVLLAPACESQTPTAPTTNPRPPEVPPVQPRESGPSAIAGSPIVIGSSVHGTVESGDPVCFRNWDASGHCRQFDLTPLGGGTLRAVLKWEAPSLGLYDPELFVVSPDGTWVYSDDPWPERHIDFNGEDEQTYRIVVIGYRLPQVFELLVDVP